MFAPFEKPTAKMHSGSRSYSETARSTNSASSWVRFTRSSWSKTPSSRRRKKRGAPFSRTLPRGLSSAADSRSMRPRGIRSSSSPPVPCKRSRVVRSFSSPGTKRWTKPRSFAMTLTFLLRCVDGREDLLDALPILLQPGRKLQALAEVVRVFVHRKAGRVGGDLEEDPARFAEVDRAEVLPVEDVGHVETAIRNLFSPLFLRCLVRRPPRDVVHRPDRRQPSGPVWLLPHVREAPAGARREVPRPPPILFCSLLEAQKGHEQVHGDLRRPLRERHARDAPDRV